MNTTGTRQIAKLLPGQDVTLKFTTRNEPLVEKHRFIGLGKDGQKATFQAYNEDGSLNPTYIWTAYRFQGRWAYGSSAQRLGIAA